MKKELPVVTHSPVIAKTRELCQTILDQPAYQRLRNDIAAFLQDDAARSQYEQVCDLQETLHRKQDEGEAVTEEEMAAFDAAETAFLAMPSAGPFIQAQEKMHEIEATVMTYLRRTFERGAVPEEDDREDAGGGGCGPGCGCHG